MTDYAMWDLNTNTVKPIPEDGALPDGFEAVYREAGGIWKPVRNKTPAEIIDGIEAGVLGILGELDDLRARLAK